MRTTTKRFNEKNGKALIVGRVILDFGLDMKAHRKKEDKWKAHKDWVAKEFAGSSAAVLLKIEIPDQDRLTCLRTLERMNINHLSLFPDLSGASRYTNLKLELK